MPSQGWYPDPWKQAPLRWWDGAEWTAHVADPSPPAPASEGVLDRVLGGAETVAVFDVETTGFRNSDRVIEIAVVTLDRHGRVIDEFDTLIDPRRDLGPTWVHRITPKMVAGAPAFEEVAHHVAARLHGAVCVAHNLPFDRRMLTNEFDRAGVRLDWGTGLDTLKATGCKLHVACADYGVELDDAHRALADARATAALFRAVADVFDRPGAPAAAGPLSLAPLNVRTRDGFAVAVVPTPFVAVMASGVHSSVDVAPYVDLLDAALADLRLTDEEIAALDALADELGIDDERRVRAHREFLQGLIDAAVEDGVVTDDEFEVLSRVAALLGIDAALVTSRTDTFRAATQKVKLLSGTEVCFTGAATGTDGGQLSRSSLEQAAAARGLVPVGSVTKRGRTLLVAADASSRSTKARAARRYGLPIASVQDFLAAMDGDGHLSAVLPATAPGVGRVCQVCGASWMSRTSAGPDVCDECRAVAEAGSTTPEPADVQAASSTAPLAPAVETLVCAECGSDWQRTRVRGRKPHRCPACVGS